ncbi:MAG: glutamate--tRNA ligase, partial [Patescibacteria group bacterium]
MVRTRIAPSPTGFPHIGTIYQAMLDRAYSLKNKGKFCIRIEDTDQSRLVQGAEQKIYEALDWFGLTEDESPRKGGNFGPYRQSERLPLYKKYAEELVKNEHAYYCFCTPERLDEMRKEQQKQGKSPLYDKRCRSLSVSETLKRVESGERHVIRMKIPNTGTITVPDNTRGDIVFSVEQVDDQVIMKSDGFPTYHLAVVVDDHLMEITHILRGSEWIPSFPKHKLLYDYFGWKMPIITHTPLITNMDGSKMSKRHGHASVSWYQEEGFLPEAVLNFMSLLGWSHPEEKEIF